MSDREPYTVEEAEFLHKHDERASSRKLLATVEALERVTRERDEALTELAEARAALVEIPVARSVAERQRAACSEALHERGFYLAVSVVRATPLVTDSTEREVET